MEITVLRPGVVPEAADAVAVPMRDGVELATDVYRPDDEARPVVLVRLPYDKDGEYCFLPSIARHANARGYTVVVQDVRGKFRSGGATEFGIHEVEDGYDTIEWITAQAWCTGDVVMWGDSYYGMTQLAAAAGGHPSLKAIAPRLTGTLLSQEVPYPDGTRDVEATSRKVYFSSWYVDRNAYEWPVDWTARPLRATFEHFFAELGRRSPNFDAEFGGSAPGLTGHLDRLLAAPPVPTLFTVGLFDNCAIYSWHDLRALLGHEEWCRAVHLRVEALDHENIHLDDVPAVPPGPDPQFLARMLDPALDFFDAVLGGRRGEIAPVHYETCHSETRSATTWPPEDACEVSLHLRAGDGALRLDERAGASEHASWRHDPDDLVPSAGENPFARLADRRDLSHVAARTDVLTFEGPAAGEPVDHAGPAWVDLALSSTVQATNVHVRLLDVDPDGAQLLVTKGQVHLSEVHSDRPVRVDLQAVCYRLRPGHRWALQLMSSDFPEYVPEPGDGSHPWEATHFAPSEQTVHLGEPGVSRLVLHRR
ncbi:CocE/NonD family hydrolase [Blastococcus sp. BMG 814]|uniref:CocE/NonD family hydrolase n=1 Tax=Blastococcus carthaginiensis TaxID=3050034 RepID=A0ABT9IDG5_9ACTN|nr:CocE/NonD family hydrolase [Blastococcus carthaginiensis]MDP5183622.1 CocE/NonD family hydrolase [Blastococcus carthaginiensis]